MPLNTSKPMFILIYYKQFKTAQYWFVPGPDFDMSEHTIIQLQLGYDQ